MDKYRQKVIDDDAVIVLHKVMRPENISGAIGKWISLVDREDEGLVEDIDAVKHTLIVLFGELDDREEYEIPFNSPDIVEWYHMSSKELQEKEEKAANLIQRAMRRKLSRKMYFNRPVVRRRTSSYGPGSSNRSKFKGLQKTHMRCMRPKLNRTKGYFVESPDFPNRRGLVEKFDLENGLIHVVYDDSDGLQFEKVYDFFDSLTWYRKIHERAESMEEWDDDDDDDDEEEFNITKQEPSFRNRYFLIYHNTMHESIETFILLSSDTFYKFINKCKHL